MTSDTFVLDANIFIEAHRRYYGLDLCPGFWESLRHFARRGRVLSIDRVYREMEDGGDSLWEWARDSSEFFVSSATPEIVEAFSEIMEWVRAEPQFRAEAKSKFASEGRRLDSRVCAGARHDRRNPRATRSECEKARSPRERLSRVQAARQRHLRDASGIPGSLRLGEVRP